MGWTHFILFGLCGAILCADGASARGVRLQGRATDAATSEPLALATVQVIGTFTGTIANDEGFFVLEVPELPVTLRVTYIGYASRERTIADSAATLGIDFRLPVTPYRLPEMIVRPDAARLIRPKSSAARHNGGHGSTVGAARPTRMTIRKEGNIIAIAEVVSEVIWQREGGYREVVVSQRRTENLDDPDMDFGTMSAVDEFIDLYDDNIDFMENELMGPTHPDALDVYDFDLIGRRLVDDRVVFDIGVRPKHKPEAAFVGRVSVVDAISP